MIENLNILSLKLFFLIETSLKKARQRVCCSIFFTLIIINLKIVTGKLLGLIDLTKAQTLSIHKLLKDIMVDKIKDIMFAVFYLMAPNFK